MRSGGERQLLLDHRLDQALDAQGKSCRGQIGAAERFEQTVEAPAAEEGILCAQVVTCDLKNGAVVVVETADEFGLDGEDDPLFGQERADALEMPFGFLFQEVEKG